MSGAGFVNGDAKIAFGLGRVTPPTRFPSSPAGEGRWVIISAQQAFRLLAPPVRGMYAGPPDRVLSVHRGTDIWETAHGTMRFPAWLFTVSGLKGTASVLALSPSDLFQPRQVSEPPPGSSVSVGSARLGDGGRVITIGFVGGQIGTKGCDDTYQARVSFRRRPSSSCSSPRRESYLQVFFVHYRDTGTTCPSSSPSQSEAGSS